MQAPFFVAKKYKKNLHGSQKGINFAALFGSQPTKRSSGCSSVRLEYASGGRGVASSNLVIPTDKRKR